MVAITSEHNSLGDGDGSEMNTWEIQEGISVQGRRIKPVRHMCVNEQRFQKQVLPNVEHLCELVNGNNDLKQKAVFMDF